MTPDKAYEIFWKAYEDCPIAGIKEVKQSELYKHALEVLMSEISKEWAEKYLALQETYKPLTYKFTNDIKKQEMSDEELKQL